ncbi:hypothetical protein P280DRAFT_474302 [Massarina eburnea CBS 473.64]|uniref:A to I editase domain-containing protein n=1 Tax=Massarina eburnea CBS 473.64 TaxID=1395130 RepID=A0A6A6RHU8_9PLEO|nr:hypothetical protein P280DRAFT_474302 [Massarina eburnea CBS 473.64]
MKCLPSTKLPLAHGTTLHDWHAEVLAIRAFNRFLLDQLHHTLTPPYPPSPFLRPRPASERTPSSFQPFTIAEDVQIYMYCSEAPCGDASMELVMQAQEDATPWTSPVPTISSPNTEKHLQELATSQKEEEEEEIISGLRGRSHFSHLGLLRYKPSRPDAPPTHSKSCTDKLTLTQTVSLLTSLTSLLISPQNAYLTTLILPSTQLIPSACLRAFTRTEGRMAPITPGMEGGWNGGYKWHGFDVVGTQREFEWCRRNVEVGKGQKAVAANMSAVWTPGWQETLIGGVLQGRKQFDPRGASGISRMGMWKVAVQIAAVAGVPMLVDALAKKTYREVKCDGLFADRTKVKEDVRNASLKGWVRNAGDDDFRLDGA